MADTIAVTFTEYEVDLCLDQAVCLRNSYLGLGCEEIEEYADRYAEARAWDVLASKLALLAGVELQRECGYCVDGVRYDRKCSACLGTTLLPPAIEEQENDA